VIAFLVVLNALFVAFEVWALAVYGGPIILACLVFTVLMFAWTLVSAAKS
jgi:hypothetical protein